MRNTTSTMLLAAALLASGQDPKPAPPAPPAVQHPVQQPAEKPAPQADKPAVVGKPERHALEGVYELRSRVVNGQTDTGPSRGYLAITNRHLFLNLAAPGTDPACPLVHAGVREWREVQGVIRTVISLEYLTDANGDLHAVPAGKEEIRRIELVRGGVRVMQTDRSWLEFERVE